MWQFFKWLIIIVIVMIPLCNIYYCLQERQETIAKGEVKKTVWMPENCTVLIGQKEWQKKFPEHSVFFIEITSGVYKDELGESGEHFAVIFPNEIHYRTFQGKVLISARDFFPAPHFVDNTDLKYLGNGELCWKVKDNKIGRVDAVLWGILGGFLLDLGVLFVGFVCFALGTIIYDIYNMMRHRPRPRTNIC